VLPVRLRERVIAFKRAAEPDILSMQGTDPRAESGGMNAGITHIGAELRLHIAKGQIFPYNT
jgi:hypothetical protein